MAIADDTAATTEPYVIKESDLVKKEASLTQNPLMQAVKASIRTLDNDSVEKIAPGRAANPDNVKRVEKKPQQRSMGIYLPTARAGIQLRKLPEGDR